MRLHESLWEAKAHADLFLFLVVLLRLLGKTQVCMTLCCEAALPVEFGGLGGGAIYIDTERVFSMDRSPHAKQAPAGREKETTSAAAHLVRVLFCFFVC